VPELASLSSPPFRRIAAGRSPRRGDWQDRGLQARHGGGEGDQPCRRQAGAWRRGIELATLAGERWLAVLLQVTGLARTYAGMAAQSG
jgi:hypothetical protein